MDRLAEEKLEKQGIAEGGSRTLMPLRTHDFESCASAGSATSARKNNEELRMKN